MDLLELCEKQPGLRELLGSFRDQSVSDYIVVYLRLLTSGYLQREHGFFQHFIEGGRYVKEFCQQVGSYWVVFSRYEADENALKRGETISTRPIRNTCYSCANFCLF